jgi:hypothetical protein
MKRHACLLFCIVTMALGCGGRGSDKVSDKGAGRGSDKISDEGAGLTWKPYAPREGAFTVLMPVWDGDGDKDEATDSGRLRQVVLPDRSLHF